ncbi:hypothetical protein IFT48_02645 [Pseudomonas fluorescens]|uniref:hypothetical protein n=1 Tax=Pseudomonas fluorescens TaxID=294 RepID=UPI001930A307|nr:hypothetical protein [Pseudomonas fluorescens]MBD8088864.1 hypothetical protein [Pseudomonas fluorescens]
MLTPQQIATRLLEGTLTAAKAYESLYSASVDERQQFIANIIDRSDLLSNKDPEPGSATTHYDRGMEVLVELFSIPKIKGVSRLINPLHDKIFDHIPHSGQSKNTLKEPFRLGMIRMYVGLQERSPTAALRFLTGGLGGPRTRRMFSELAPYIDKPLIIDTAIGLETVDHLFKKSNWDDCLPHLSGTGRDAYIGRDLGL